MKKRVLGMLLAICFVVSLVPATVFAEDGMDDDGAYQPSVLVAANTVATGDTSNPTVEAEALYQTEADGVWLEGGFADALENVYDGGVVKLCQDVWLASTTVITKSVTLTSNDPENPSKITSAVSGHGYLLNVYGTDKQVKLEQVILDGGSAQNVTASCALIGVGSAAESISGNLIVGSGAVLQNNQNVTSKGKGGGITVAVGSAVMEDGAEIKNCQAALGGGAAIVELSTNEFIINGGSVSHNTATLNGGAAFIETGTFTLNGGNVSENTADLGGALYLYKDSGNIQILKGTIANNRAEYAGGLFLECGKCTLSGGSIMQNYASEYGGGVFAAPFRGDSAYPGATIDLSGNIQITGNTSGGDSTDSNPIEDNLYLDGDNDGTYDYMPTTNVSGSLDGANIGIRTRLKPTETENLLLVSSGAGYTMTNQDFKAFTSDDTGYALVQREGDVYLAIPSIPLPKLVGHSLTLDGTVGVNFYYTIDDAYLTDEYDAKVMFTCMGNTVEVPLDTSKVNEVNDEAAYRFQYGVYATRMTENIEAKFVLTKGDETIATIMDDYCVKDYFDTAQQIEDEKLEAMVNAMSTYGHYAQSYFKVNPQYLPEAVLDVSAVTADSLAGYAASMTTFEGATLHHYGSTLYLDSATALRFYLTETEGLENVCMAYRVKGSEGEYQYAELGYSELNQKYYGEIPNIAAHYLDDLYEVYFCTKDTHEQLSDVKTYGAMSYAYAALTRETPNEALNQTVRGLKLYGDATRNYFLK